MSTTVSFINENLSTVLSYLKYFIPAGDTSLNVQIGVANKKLFIACQTYMQFKATLADCNMSDISISVIYRDLSPFIKSSDEVTFEFNENYLVVSTSTFTATLPASYDIINVDIDMPDNKDYIILPGAELFSSLKTFIGSSSLFKLYRQENPYTVYDGIIVLKTPTVWFQGLAKGLSLNATMTAKVLHTFIELAPIAYCLKDNRLFISGVDYTCVLQVTPIVEENNFRSLMTELSSPITFNTSNILETLTSIVNMKPQFVSLGVSQAGISVSVTIGNYSLKKTVGKYSDTIYTCRLSAELLQLSFKLMKSNSTIQILYGDNILCLRNQTLIILLRVMR